MDTVWKGEGEGGAGLKPKPPEATVCASSCGFACARRVRSCCGGSRKGGARMGGQSPGFSSDCPVSGRGSLASLGSGSWSCLLHPLHPKVAVFLQASDQHFPPSFLDELVQGCLLSAPSWDLCRVQGCFLPSNGWSGPHGPGWNAGQPFWRLLFALLVLP